MENNIEYLKLFMEYESDDMPVVYFYEIDVKNDRFMLREIEVFSDRTVKTNDVPYYGVIEIVPIPTVEEFNAKIWGKNFFAIKISENEFHRIWETNIYDGDLSVAEISIY